MRFKLITTLLILCLSVGICLFSLIYVSRTVAEMKGMCDEATGLARNGQTEAAEKVMGSLDELWDQHKNWLEVLISHEDVHNVKEQLVEARKCLENEWLDQYETSVGLLVEALNHIHDHEALTLSNIM